MTPFQFAAPREISSPKECHFYHTMDLPGVGVIEGEWDLRGGLDDYLGHIPLSGKRLLDVGAATGAISFHAESRGAEVVSFDLSEDFSWDLVPSAGADEAGADALRRGHLRAINNGYWFCHRALGSRARLAHGVVYDIPRQIGPVDIAVFGSILLHLRDPFLALQNGARLARETIVVADMPPMGGWWPFGRSPIFLPRSSKAMNDTWWRLPPGLIREYLAILGFADQTTTWRRQTYRGRRRLLYTIVARRTAGAADGVTP